MSDILISFLFTTAGWRQVILQEAPVSVPIPQPQNRRARPRGGGRFRPAE